MLLLRGLAHNNVMSAG